MAGPRITVKSVAAILLNSKSNTNTTTILHDQKYPAADPQKFRTPYYQGAIAAIRQYYAAANDTKILAHWRSKLSSIKNEARRTNNVRALDVFAASSLSKRKLTPTVNKRYLATINGVTISLSADMQATQSGALQIVYFHCRATSLDLSVADMITNVANLVLSANGVVLTPMQIEVIDLCVGKSLRASAWNSTTQKNLAVRTAAISQLWAQI
jgi:hypothetical protein